ncbi:GyrI-like domain-containing protein [Vallitalea okinawensis]|uniref:GyrI-like domain-containing protein n=1 Tax=Vallitalea okinawensis TaxID=2078660 RepID=UPI000CFCB839|nr:effector binding domain-containing protein [Vallitalea okinawensis]
MNFQIKLFPQDRVYIGLKYDNENNSSYTDIHTFWQHFTEKLYSSEFTDRLIENHEAIGYREYLNESDKRESYQYYAACEIEYCDEINDFHKIIIPKGEYILFKVNYKNKDREIREIIKEYLPRISREYKLNEKFDLEYYTEEFNYQDNNTYLYLAFQILGHH